VLSMEISQPEQAFNHSETTFTGMVCPPLVSARQSAVWFN